MKKSSNQNVKEKMEMDYFNRFMKVFSHVPKGHIEKSEEPDVKIYDETGRCVLGVEITNLYLKHGSDRTSEQQQVVFREQLIFAAQEMYEKRGLPKYQLLFDFDPDFPVFWYRSDAKNQSLVKRLIDCIEDFLIVVKPEKGYRKPFDSFPELSFLHVFRKPENEKMLWEIQQSYDIPRLHPEIITRAIHEKTRRLEHYQDCDQYWLLIVIDSWEPAQDQDIPRSFSMSVEQTPFEKIFVYKIFTGEVLEIQQKIS